jgi:energy-coupling factor transporter ATP-binding protein EcfA2
MLDRSDAVARVTAALRRSQVVLVLGPRQSGKTTLARGFVKPDSPNYFDLESPPDAARLAEPMTALSRLKGTVVIDEIQRRPELFPALRVLADRKPLPARFLVLGSAAPALLRQSSESLAGRVERVQLGPFTLAECGVDRLDARFRLAPAILQALVARERFGFAVFQLRGLTPTPAPSLPWWRQVFAPERAPPHRAKDVHPMALTFRTRTPETLFLPTVHVHDGTLPETASFDHTLFVQGSADETWYPSAAPPSDDLVRRAQGVLAGGERVWRLDLKGERPNRDVLTLP